MIELRWIICERTTAEPKRLQYRHTSDSIGGKNGPWCDVPIVVVPDNEFFHPLCVSPSAVQLKEQTP